MPATTNGDAIFGLDDQDGLYIEDFSEDWSIEEETFRDATGNEVGGQLFNPTCSWSMTGVQRTSGTALDTKLGASLTLANFSTIGDFVEGYTSGGITYTLAASPSANRQQIKTIDISGRFLPFATS